MKYNKEYGLFLDKMGQVSGQASLCEAIHTAYKACCEASLLDYKDNAILYRPGKIDDAGHIELPRVIAPKGVDVEYGLWDADTEASKQKREAQIRRANSYVRYMQAQLANILTPGVENRMVLNPQYFNLCDDAFEPFAMSALGEMVNKCHDKIYDAVLEYVGLQYPDKTSIDSLDYKYREKNWPENDSKFMAGLMKYAASQLQDDFEREYQRIEAINKE